MELRHVEVGAGLCRSQAGMEKEGCPPFWLQIATSMALLAVLVHDVTKVQRGCEAVRQRTHPGKGQPFQTFVPEWDQTT